MNDSIVREFSSSGDTLRVYREDRLLFASDKERLLPLLEYTETCAPYEKDVTVLDRVVGNAAALLLARVFCRETYGDLGSELAAKTLDQIGISHRFAETVPHIENNRRDGMCPMEELSLGKTPDEFHRALMERVSGNQG
jgi:hypothetical protein